MKITSTVSITSTLSVGPSFCPALCHKQTTQVVVLGKRLSELHIHMDIDLSLSVVVINGLVIYFKSFLSSE